MCQNSQPLLTGAVLACRESGDCALLRELLSNRPDCVAAFRDDSDADGAGGVADELPLQPWRAAEGGDGGAPRGCPPPPPSLLSNSR